MAKKKTKKKTVSKKKTTKKKSSSKKTSKKTSKNNSKGPPHRVTELTTFTQKKDGRRTRNELQIDDPKWRKKLQSALKFDDNQKGVFLVHYARFGRKTQSAKAAGVVTQTVNNHMEADEEFSVCVMEAKQLYRDRIAEQAYRLAVDGIDEPVFGGRYRDEIVGYIKRFSTRILAMEMRRTDPEHRDKGILDINVKSGVLVVSGEMSLNKWREKYEGGEVIEGEVVSVKE